MGTGMGTERLEMNEPKLNGNGKGWRVEGGGWRVEKGGWVRGRRERIDSVLLNYLVVLPQLFGFLGFYPLFQLLICTHTYVCTYIITLSMQYRHVASNLVPQEKKAHQPYMLLSSIDHRKA
jgi:hypothetical protein